jgi:hypothetical protein
MTKNQLAGKYGLEATHSGGRGEIFHDWFPYLEGFSRNFVVNIVEKYLPNAKLIIEPFSGVGTTPISLAQMGISTKYCEVNPVLQHLVRIKAQSLSTKVSDDLVSDLNDFCISLKKRLKITKPDMAIKDSYKNCFDKSIYFYEETLDSILKLKTIERDLSPPLKDYFSIAVYSSLLEGSLLKRAGDVRFKTEKDLLEGVPDILGLVISKLNLIGSDLVTSVKIPKSIKLQFEVGDSKELNLKGGMNADGVITSPPYLNGTNYFRNTRLELWYMEIIKQSKDLRSLRDKAITAGINDVSKESGDVVLKEVKRYHKKISKVCYDSRIPKMIAAYFNDMKLVFLGIQKNIKKDGIVCVDIGDSIYSNIHIPTHSILSDIAKSIGWTLVDEVILRERFSNNGSKLTQRLLIFKNA